MFLLLFLLLARPSAGWSPTVARPSRLGVRLPAAASSPSGDAASVVACVAAALPATATPTETAAALVAAGDAYGGRALGRTEGRKVSGCVSVVRVLAEADGDGRAVVHVSSDARVTKGVAVLLAAAVGGRPVAEARRLAEAADAAAVVDGTGLSGVLSAARRDGVGAILRAVAEALAALEAPPAAAAAPAAYVSGLRPEDDEVAVLLSGGVDSSVALQRVMDAGLKPKPFYLKIWLQDELAHLGECPWEEDLEYATAVCKAAGSVPLEVVPLQTEYWDHVVSYTIGEAREGRTPNPDVMCNSRIKFGFFNDLIGSRYERVATGHYARSSRALGEAASGAPAKLLRSADRWKDQTYFLSRLTQAQLHRAAFPIGDMEKPAVRELARALGLPTSGRADSQGICFLGKLPFDEFLRHYLGDQPGPVVDLATGKEIGRHRGIWYHTIGQRKGLGGALADHAAAFGPWYVAAKDPKTDTVFATNDYDAVAGPRLSFCAADMSWISGAPPAALSVPGGTARLEVQVRHGSTAHMATVTAVDDRTVLVDLDERDSGLAAGQFAAMYDGDECLGAGAIELDPRLVVGAKAGSEAAVLEFGA